MTMKYKIGDVVKIREDLKSKDYPRENGTYTIWCSQEMVDNYAGTIGHTISQAFEDEGYYYIDDSNTYMWTASMFEDEPKKR